MNTSLIDPCINVSLSASELNNLVQSAKDWVIMHGALMRSKSDFNQVQVAPFLFLPSTYPRKEFKKSQEVQTLLNELMHKVAYDHEFLCDTLKGTIEADPFTAKLFDIYCKVYAEGFSQSISLGLIRSDYMLHDDDGENKIKQVEINMISTSFAGLAVVTTEYQKYILSELNHRDKVANIPENDSADGFSNGLVEAWKSYNNKKAVILVVVEDVVHNVFDQRALEFRIRKSNPEIQIIRKTLTDLITSSSLQPNKKLLVDNVEVAVIYYRTGYQLEAYPTEKEWQVRLLLERSQAIKCPSIHYHLAGTKKIQQQLAVPGVLERFYTDTNVIRKIKELFMGIYALDLNEEGDKAAAIAIENPEKYVLKPQREGGGNNVYNDAIKTELERMKNSKDRTAYILMERIFPPVQKNYLIRNNDRDLKMQDFITELGIYGVVMGDKNKIMLNTQVGHVLRTKPSSADEGGIVSGAGALDCPYLVD